MAGGPTHYVVITIKNSRHGIIDLWVQKLPTSCVSAVAVPFDGLWLGMISQLGKIILDILYVVFKLWGAGGKGRSGIEYLL